MYTQAGAWAVPEQLVPELARNPPVRADIRIREGAAAPVRFCDVVVTHPIKRERGFMERLWCRRGSSSSRA